MTSAFYVHGVPVQQGSMTCKSKHAPGFRANLQPDNEKELDPWRAKVAAAAQRDYPGTGPVIRYPQYAPVAVEITYSVPRPVSHYGTGRNADTVKPSAPRYPTARGTRDIDKLERAILDALTTAGVLHDDAQVVDVTHRKRYAAPDQADRDVLPVPGIVVRLHPGGDPR